MKTKKFDKKLSFNKKTIANLANQEMATIKGGTSVYIGCPPMHSLPRTECFVCQP